MRLVWLWLIAPAALAHVVSMSTSDAKLNGSQLDVELRMPVYEVAHLKQPESALFDNLHFFGAGDEARRVRQTCREESENLVCSATFVFPRDVDEFSVRCTFPSITVPNHVHLLRATHGPLNDQAAFDSSFTEATLRFRPPTATEIFVREAGAGFWRAIAGPAQILFLIALLLAARGWRDLGLLFGTFAAGQLAGALLIHPERLGLAPRFIEAAAALSVAYLAVELVMLPNAGGRWVVTGVLGLFHGMYFSMLLTAGEYQPGLFLSGALSAEALLATAAFFGVRRIPFQRALGYALLVVGLGWFILRLRS